MVLDRFSEIPEELRINILSRLPPMDAVRTSALAKGWRHSWNDSLWNFYFNDQDYRIPVLLYDQYTNRENLFHTIFPMIQDLLTENDDKKILKMELVLNSCLTLELRCVQLVTNCVQMAVGPKLVHLYLNLSFHEDIFGFLLEDLNLTSCLNLKTLRLSNAFIVQVPEEYWLPSIRTLEMDMIYCDVFQMNQFLESCFNCRKLYLNFFPDDIPGTLSPPLGLDKLTVIVNGELVQIDDDNLGAPLELVPQMYFE